MKRFIYLVLVVLICLPGCARGDKDSNQKYVVGFYNLENLFDTVDDPAKNDDDFLPEGSYQWDDVKYQKKLDNMAKVIAAIAERNGRYHSLLGICEVENRQVVEDLVSQPSISEANFQIVHYESPDSRGIDVALLYNPDEFTLLDSEAIPFDFNSEDIDFDMDAEAQKSFKTRDVLMAHGTLAGEEVAVFVAHLPSRIGGKGGDLRDRGAEIIYDRAMQLSQEYPGIKIIVMGDMNDDPTNDSMIKYLHARKTPDEVGADDFFLPFIAIHDDGIGTLAYQGAWNLFDNILVNQALVTGDEGGLHIIQTGEEGYYGVVFNTPWMLVQDGKYAGTPARTYVSRQFQEVGFSDHLPTYIVLEK